MLPTHSTSERFLWVLLLILAAVLRLGGLAAVPLSSDEASQALAAFSVSHRPPLVIGQDAQWSGVEIPPFLFHINVLLFALFHGGDGLARLVPALCGVALVATPLLLRRYLGRWGALGSGLMLAFSPTVLAYSRTLDGAVPAALGVMMLVSAFARYLDSWRPLWLPLSGVGLALALTAGPAGWGLLAGLLLALAAGLYFWREQVAWYWPMIRPALIRGLTACGLGLFAFGAGLGFHLAGLAAVGEQLLRWLRVSPSAVPFAPVILVSEPLILLAGVCGAVLALTRRHRMGLLWLFWTLVGGAQWLLGFGEGRGQALSLLVPLAGLGGTAVEELVSLLRKRVHGVWGGVYPILSLILWAHAGLILARYSRYGQWTELFLAGISLTLQVILALIFGLTISVRREDETPQEATRRAFSTALGLVGAALGMVLVLVTLATGVRVASCSDDPACALTPDPIAPDVRLLADLIRYVGARHGLLWPPVAFLEEPDPALVWALREFDMRVIGGDEIEENRPLMLVAPDDVPPPAGYVGSVFTLRRSWSLPEKPHYRVRWWLYRSAPVPFSPSDRVVLWVHAGG